MIRTALVRESCGWYTNAQSKIIPIFSFFKLLSEAFISVMLCRKVGLWTLDVTGWIEEEVQICSYIIFGIFKK